MSKVIKFPNADEKHFYFIDECAGCHDPITDEYTEVTMPYFDKGIKHIALCDKCDHTARQNGAY